MKKQILIGSLLLAAVSAFPQTANKKPKSSGLIDTRILAESKFISQENESTKSPVKATAFPTAQSASKTNITNTWNNITASMNIIGVTISFGKPLQWNDELNAVTFVHRKSPSYQMDPTPSSVSETGGIVTMISTDCGGNWDSTALYANDNFWGRYPNGAIYNPPTNTDINNAYIVGAGPTTGAGSVTWIGNWYASKQLGSVNYDNKPSTTSNAVQVMPTAGPYPPNVTRHDFTAYGFTATDDGKMRVMAGVRDDGLASDVEVMLMTGTFNNGVFDWVGKTFDPPTTQESDGTENWVSRPAMAWNEAGTIGYVVIMGSRLGATGSNVGYQPIVYKTTNSGGTWSLESSINFNGATGPFADVKRSITSVNTDNTLEVPNFFWGEGFDCAVDMNGKLHIFAAILGHASNDLDSLNYVSQFTTEKYYWPHTPGFRPYMYDFIYDGTNPTPSWSHVTIDSMSTESPGTRTQDGGYTDNPWDGDPANANTKVVSDARLQMSRTPDGKYLVYTFSESDTTFTTNSKKWNTLPNVKARVMDASTGVVHPVTIDVTGTAPGDIASRAMMHYISPKCRVSSTVTTNGPAITIPITVSNSNPYAQLTPNTHWFSWATLNFGNVPDNQIKLCGALSSTTDVSVGENISNSASNSFVYPNPTNNSTTLNINLTSNTKVQIEVLNTIGQVVKSTKVDGQSGSNSIQVDLSGLATGIYMMNVKVDNATSTKKLIIE